jgi:hypothetical protein
MAQNTESALEDAAELIEDLVSQGCYIGDDGTLDSCAISTYADALRWLAARGRVEIATDVGRRVIARWVQLDGSGAT